VGEAARGDPVDDSAGDDGVRKGEAFKFLCSFLFSLLLFCVLSRPHLNPSSSSIGIHACETWQSCHVLTLPSDCDQLIEDDRQCPNQRNSVAKEFQVLDLLFGLPAFRGSPRTTTKTSNTKTSFIKSRRRIVLIPLFESGHVR
jgi:hypothetical protein